MNRYISISSLMYLMHQFFKQKVIYMPLMLLNICFFSRGLWTPRNCWKMGIEQLQKELKKLN